MKRALFSVLLLFALLSPACGQSPDLAGDAGFQEALNEAVEDIFGGGEVQSSLEVLVTGFSGLYPEGKIYSALQSRIEEELAVIFIEIDEYDTRIEASLARSERLLAQIEEAADPVSLSALIDRFEEYEIEHMDIKCLFEQARFKGIVDIKHLYRKMAEGLERLVDEMAEMIDEGR